MMVLRPLVNPISPILPMMLQSAVTLDPKTENSMNLPSLEITSKPWITDEGCPEAS
jgi:hypothetical protein